MMKNINKNYFLARILGLGLCMFFYTGLISSYAQDDATDEEEVVVAKKQPRKKELPKYEMKEVSGQVIDAATKKPLSGVRIETLDDARYSAMTEEDGCYKFSVPIFATSLYISTPDYNPVQIAIQKSSQVTKLYSSAFTSFYKNGTDIFTNKSVNIQDASSITAETEIGNLLEGNIRTIGRGGLPGLGANMMINGITTLNTTSQPLVVVDGVIWDMQYDRTTQHTGFLNNVLSTLDVEDIESIKVLNSGTSLYGAKGSNGVIEITTKRGRNRATRIQVRLYGGFETTPTTQKVMDGKQFRNYMTDILGTYEPASGSSVYSALARIARQSFMNEDPNYTYYGLYHNNTDWQKDLYKTAFTQNYRVNVQGGDDVALYGLSLGYTTSDATLKKNSFDRLNIRFNTDIEMFRKVFASFDISYARNTYYVLDNGWGEDYAAANISSPNILGTLVSPMISKYKHVVYWDEAAYMNRMYQDDKVYSGKDYTENENPFRFSTGYGTPALANPFWILTNGDGDNKNYQEQTQFTLNFNPRYEINEYFTLGDRFSYILNSTSEKYYLPWDGTPSKFVEGLGTIRSAVRSQSSTENEISNNLYLSFKKNFGAHNLKALAGFRLNSFSYSDSYLSGYNNSNDKMPNMSLSLAYLTYGGDNDKWLDLSYYLHAGYQCLTVHNECRDTAS